MAHQIEVGRVYSGVPIPAARGGVKAANRSENADKVRALLVGQCVFLALTQNHATSLAYRIGKQFGRQFHTRAIEGRDLIGIWRVS